MEKLDPLQAYIAHSVEFFGDDGLIDWASKYVFEKRESWDAMELLDLMSINRSDPRQVEVAHNFLKKFVERRWPDFEMSGQDSQNQAKKFFRIRLTQYLAGECTPYDVCRMVVPIEQYFDFPDWLGDMFNACDWIEPDTDPSECTHLKDAIKELLDNS